MFSALLKAFTGRAGFLASLLALSLIVLIAATVVLKLPQIQQKLVNSAQPVLTENLAEGDKLTGFRFEGRDLLLDGEFKDEPGLAAKLGAIEGIRHILLNDEDSRVDSAQTGTGGSTDWLQGPRDFMTGFMEPSEEVATSSSLATAEQIEEVPSGSGHVVEVVATATEPSGSATEVSTDPQLVGDASQSDAAGSDAAGSDAAGSDAAGSDTGVEVAMMEQQPQNEAESGQEAPGQSSLALRYDGTKLRLTGHLADAQMAQLVIGEVLRAIPGFAEMEAEVDGDGSASALNWMREFLDVISDLPRDAQGVITGSDREGVQVIPDAEQRLRKNLRDVNDNDQVVEPADQASADITEADQDPAQLVQDIPTDASADEEAGEAVENPGEYIVALNKRLAAKSIYKTGEYRVSEQLAGDLNELVEFMQRYPRLLLRVVGNIDFESSPRVGAFVGMDRAQGIRDYLYKQGIERFRVEAAPMPRQYAFDKRVQVVFYISE